MSTGPKQTDPATNDKQDYTIALLVEHDEQEQFPDALRAILDNSIDGVDIVVLDLTQSNGTVSNAVHAVAKAFPDSAGRVSVQELPNSHTNPFGRAVQHFARRGGATDLLLVSGLVRVPYGWDARLRRAACHQAHIATASPMCDISDIFGLLLNTEKQQFGATEPEAVDRLAYVLSDRRYYEVPSFFPGCVYIRGHVLETAAEITAQLPDGDDVPCSLANTLRKRGAVHVICDHLYTTIVGAGKHWLSGPDELSEDGTIFADAHPLISVRHAVADALDKDLRPTAMPGLDTRPVQLHVIHSWGGGLEKWVADYSSAATDRINLVFKSVAGRGAFGSRVALYMDIRDNEPIRTWDLSLPIRSTAVAHLEYRRVIRQLVEEFSVDTVFVSSLIGHSLDCLSTNRKTLVVGHDYYPFCPAIYIHYDGVCSECGPQRLKDCFSENGLNVIVDDYSTPEWIALREAFHSVCKRQSVTFVIPTLSVKHHLCELDPRFGEYDFQLIRHGNPSIQTPISVKKPAGKERKRILVLGRLTMEKGLDLFREARSELVSFADLYLVGCGESGEVFANEAGIHAVPRYELHALPGILEEIAPDIGLLLSVWPETFSYTLSELLALGIPPVASRLGGFAERIEEGVTGFLFQPTREALLQYIQELLDNPDKLEQVRLNLKQYRQRSLEEMVDDYSQLLSIQPLSPARYALQIGLHTGLTVPYQQILAGYRHLEKGYRDLENSYCDLENSYRHTENSYHQSNQAYQELSDAYAKVSQLSEQRREDVDRLKQAHDKMTTHLDELSAQNRELEQQRQQLQSELDQFRATRIWQIREFIAKVVKSTE